MKMATIDQVRELILKLKKKNITAADIKPEARLVQDLKLDSLDMAELLVLTEEILSADVTHDDLKQLTTIASVVEFFDQHPAK
jgi:acyl carrier protein